MSNEITTHALANLLRTRFHAVTVDVDVPGDTERGDWHIDVRAAHGRQLTWVVRPGTTGYGFAIHPRLYGEGCDGMVMDHESCVAVTLAWLRGGER